MKYDYNNNFILSNSFKIVICSEWLILFRYKMIQGLINSVYFINLSEFQFILFAKIWLYFWTQFYIVYNHKYNLNYICTYCLIFSNPLLEFPPVFRPFIHTSTCLSTQFEDLFCLCITEDAVKLLLFWIHMCFCWKEIQWIMMWMVK